MCLHDGMAWQSASRTFRALTSGLGISSDAVDATILREREEALMM